jgi:hypothetical protein
MIDPNTLIFIDTPAINERLQAVRNHPYRKVEWLEHFQERGSLPMYHNKVLTQEWLTTKVPNVIYDVGIISSILIAAERHYEKLIFMGQPKIAVFFTGYWEPTCALEGSNVIWRLMVASVFKP